jgi:hypothetical protein
MNDSSERAPGTLLYELESIQTLLGEQGEDLTSIPILRDVVSDGSKPVTARIAEQQVPTLNIDVPTLNIEASKKIETSAKTAHYDSDYQRELLIQEVVDEFIPAIEASLREKLHRLTDEELQALLKNS